MSALGDLVWRGCELDAALALCVLVHGRGQTPEDMDEAIIRHLTVAGVAFALPRAAGKSWYTARAVDPLTPLTRDQLGQSLMQLGQAMDVARAAVAGRPLMLAGFSQGACLSIEHVARGAAAQALVAFTGCRVGVVADARPAVALAGLPVYLTGGDADPWIPVAAFADAVGEFGRMGAMLRADLFPGRAHVVSAPELAMLDSILGDLASGRSVTMGTPR